jgi:hypothetical protein
MLSGHGVAKDNAHRRYSEPNQRHRHGRYQERHVYKIVMSIKRHGERDTDATLVRSCFHSSNSASSCTRVPVHSSTTFTYTKFSILNLVDLYSCSIWQICFRMFASHGAAWFACLCLAWFAAWFAGWFAALLNLVDLLHNVDCTKFSIKFSTVVFVKCFS